MNDKKMSSKQIWKVVILTSIIVSIVTSLIVLSLGKSLFLAPVLQRYATAYAVNPISSNSYKCNADSICEVNNLLSTDTISIQGEWPHNVLLDGGAIAANTGSFESSLTANYLEAKDVIYQSGNFPYTTLIDGGTIMANVLIAEGYLKVKNYTGNGNAYACIDSTGKLFRKNSPCA